MLTSNNKTILVFSDPHLQIDKLNKILSTETYDIAVCLGDWFDSFYYDNTTNLEKTCTFLKEWLFKSNFYTCIGNHDIHYLYDNPFVICSGFRMVKNDFIRKCLGDKIGEIRDRFLWYIWIDNYLCSHAGLNAYHFKPRMEINKQSISTWLDKEISQAEVNLKSNQSHWLYGAGEARYGPEKFGGITWQDFNHEFKPIDGLNQIVGHTYHSSVVCDPPESDPSLAKNLDIDCTLNQYLIIKDGKLQVKSYSSL